MKKTVRVFKVIKKNDLEQICRCCLSQDAITKNIFELVHDNVEFVEIFSTLLCTPVNIDDGMPRNICESCLQEVTRFYNFKRNVDKVRRILLTIVTKNIYKSSEQLSHNSNFKDCLNHIGTSEGTSEQSSTTVLKQSENNNKDAVTEEELINNEEINTDIEELLVNKENETENNPQESAIVKKTKTSTRVKQFRTNTQNKAQERIFSCSCLQTFTSRIKYKIHRKEQNHHDPPRFLCKICNKIFSRRSFLRHKYKHFSEKQFQCKFCGIRFTLQCTLQRHEQIHTGDKRYMCEFCGKAFIRAGDFRIHRRLHTGEKPFLCEHCGERFRSEVGYRLHKKRHVRRQFKSELNYPDKIFHSGKKYKCSICGTSFHYEKSLKMHYYKQHFSRDLSCIDCKMEFSNPLECNTHFEQFHGEGTINSDNDNIYEDKYQCKHCRKNYSSQKILDIHILIHYLSETKSHVKKSQCIICDKIFTSYGYLKTHMRTHTGEKPFACSECSKKFAYASSLREHQARHKK